MGFLYLGVFWRFLFSPLCPSVIDQTVQFSSVTQLCSTLWDLMDCSIPGLLVHYQFLELAQTHVQKLVMPSNHLIPCRPLLFLPSIFLSIRVFSNESVLRIRWSPSLLRGWQLDYKEGWALKSWCFQTVGLEKTLESFLECKEIKPVNPKGNQLWKDWLLMLKFQYFGYLMWKADSLEKTLILEKVEGRRRGW